MKDVKYWDGKSLPPVGVLCEFNYHPYLNWPECEVINHFYDGERYAAVVLLKDSTGHVICCQGYPEDFRPIYTAEQIEEKRKEIEISEIERIISSKVSDRRAVISLYELGYRKMEEI